MPISSISVSNEIQNRFPTLKSQKRKKAQILVGSRGSSSKRPAAPKVKKSSATVYKDLVLLQSPETDIVPTHQARLKLELNEMVVHSYPIEKLWSESELRTAIYSAFENIPLSCHFSFVKSCYGKIIPVKLASFDSARVLNLSGQGAIYIRPDNDLLSTSDSVSSDEDEQEVDKVLLIKSEVIDAGPGVSSILSREEELMQLKEMFPNRSDNDLREYLSIHGTVSLCALALSHTDCDFESPGLHKPEEKLTCVVKLIAEKMKEKEKLKVDEDDLLNDALCYYKDDEFDACKSLRIQYRGQPSIDTGGVSRHFFTDVLKEISKLYFEGDTYKLPIYNADVVASKLMTYIGRIVVHSIIHGGPGLPLFSHLAFNYFVDGNFDSMMQLVTVEDCSLAVQDFVKKVVQTEVGELDQEELMFFLTDAGITMTLTNDNKDRILRSIIMHDAVGKRKTVLDQFISGLDMLGFRSEMKKAPSLFEVLFVHNLARLDGERILSVLDFLIDEDDNKIKEFLEHFLKNTTNDLLKKFLVFASGAPSLPCFGLGKITVKTSQCMGISGQTCSKEITFPKSISDQILFNSTLEAVLYAQGHSFNCV